MPDMKLCLCEHEAHFDVSGRTPKGALTHKYGAPFAAEDTKNVVTLYGSFQVCTFCADDCYHPTTLKKAGLA